MKLPARLDTALIKLYTAYTDQELHPEDACRCAVGNILDRKDFWKNLSDDHGSLQLNYIGRVHEGLGRRFFGYKASELLQIERAFLKGCGYSLPLSRSNQRPINPTDPDTLFNGLSEALTVLFSLEGLENQWELTVHLESLQSLRRNQPVPVSV